MTPGGFRPRKSGLISGFRRRLRSLRKNWLLAFLIDLVAIVGFALILSVLIKAFLIRSFFIPSGSMLDTLQINDRIIVNVLAPEVVELQHGDVVVFKDPGGWLGVASAVEKEPLEQLGDFVLGTFGITAPDSAEHLVKRVIGLPGDVITCCDADGKLLLNGLPLDEPYLRAGSNPSDIEFSVTVPAGQLWVMGDNRGNSTDSRYHQDLPTGGFVPIDVVVGRAMLISWPVENWTYLDNYQDTFNVVPKP
ncbi:signal peptidase I [bacterium]|jgi:signal peptidase I|nr:signal peptidase I [bacterium]